MSPLLGRRRGTDAADAQPVDILFQIGASAITLPDGPVEAPLVAPDTAPVITPVSAADGIAADTGDVTTGSPDGVMGLEVEAGVDEQDVQWVAVEIPGDDIAPPAGDDAVPFVNDDDVSDQPSAAPDDPDSTWYSAPVENADMPDAQDADVVAPAHASIDEETSSVVSGWDIRTLRADIEGEIAQLQAALASEQAATEDLRSQIAQLAPASTWEHGEESGFAQREQQLTLMLQRIDALEFARDAMDMRLGVLAAATEDADGDDVISRLEQRLRDLDGQADDLADQRSAIEDMVREFEVHQARWSEDARAVSAARENGESAVITLKVHAETAEAHVRGVEGELTTARELAGQVRDLREAVARDHLLITTERTEAKANVELIHDHCDRAAQAEVRAREAAESAQRAGAQAREHAAEGLQLAERARARIDDVRDLHERLAETFSQQQTEQAALREDLRREMQDARASLERVNAEAVELRELTEQARQGSADAEIVRDRIAAADEHIAREVARLDEIVAAAAARAETAERTEQKMADAEQQLASIRRDAEGLASEAERARVDAAEVASLRAEAERVRSLIDRASEQLEDSTRQAGHQREQIDALSAAAGTRMAQMDEEITRLRGDAGRAHGLLAAATSVRETLDEEIAAIRVEREQLHAEREELRELASGVRSDSQIWSERLKRATDQIEGLEQELRTAREQISMLVSEQRADSADIREQRMRASEEIALIIAERENAERIIATLAAQGGVVPSAGPDPVNDAGDLPGHAPAVDDDAARDGAEVARELKPAIADAVARHGADPDKAELMSALRDAAVTLARATGEDVAAARTAVERALEDLAAEH